MPMSHRTQRLVGQMVLFGTVCLESCLAGVFYVAKTMNSNLRLNTKEVPFRSDFVEVQCRAEQAREQRT